MNARKKYDSAVVFLYTTGNEHLLPKHFRKQIPYTTIASWRKADYRKYIGYEYRGFFDQAFDSAELRMKYYRMKSAMMGFARSWVSLSSAIVPLVKNAGKDRVAQVRILQAIRYMSAHIGLERALKMIGLSKTLYYQWLLESRFDCFDSYHALCMKRHPHQLQMNEINKMKKMLLDPEYDHWPICSIAALALRKKNVVASLYSWYKYAKIHNIIKKPMKKQLKTVGLVAKHPNEYLHVDTTFYPLMDGRNICISFVLDNYSKMILGYHVAERNTFEIVRRSMTHALKTIAKHPDVKHGGHSYMVTDGGSENHNKNINGFIAKLTKHKITKIRALKDIRFSNSPVEAVHKTMKSRYLRSNRFATIAEVRNYLKWAVHDYNMLRPHYKHRPRTPHEVYFGIKLTFDVRKRTLASIKARVKANKNVKCIQCKAFREGKKCDSSCGTN